MKAYKNLIIIFLSIISPCERVGISDIINQRGDLNTFAANMATPV